MSEGVTEGGGGEGRLGKRAGQEQEEQLYTRIAYIIVTSRYYQIIEIHKESGTKMYTCMYIH